MKEGIEGTMGDKTMLNDGSAPPMVKTADDSESRKAKEKEAMKLLLEDLEEGDTTCGFGPCHFRWLQFLARKEIYMLVYCMVQVTKGMFFTYSVSVISTVEKRFKLTSKQTGATLTGNDVSQVILAIFLGYFGNFGHRPRWMGIGVMMASMSCFVAAMPHFIYGVGQDAIDLVQATSAASSPALNASQSVSKFKKVEVCYAVPEDTCMAQEDGGGSGSVAPVVMLFFSQFLVGIAVCITNSIGITYMDDNINKKTYPLYYAATLLLRIMGPVLGFLMGGKFLSLWIDPNQSPNLSRRDPRWMGAWWCGYLVIGSGLLLSGVLLFFFPKKLPETVKREAKKIAKQAEKDEKEGENRGVTYFFNVAKNKKTDERPNIANLKKALKRLFTNRLWVGNLFNTCVIVLAFSCYWNFKPKYLENQFRKSAAEANYYTGVTSMVSVSMGTVLGGAILRWVRPGPRFVTGYNIFITLFSFAGFLVLMSIGCPKLKVIGPVEGNPVPECSSDCGCSNKFSPMCAEDNTTLFYSPCYAGCTTANTSASPVAFSGCSCVTNATWVDLGTTNAFQVNGEGGTSGYCEEDCAGFYWYLGAQVVMKTVSATARVSSSVIHLRSVADEDKGVALGTLTAFLSCFGLIPGPIIMGAAIDATCLVWDLSCGKRGNCWLYDSDKFRIVMHMVPAVFTFISVFGDIVVFYYSRQLDLYGDREMDIQEEKTQGKTEESKPLNKDKDDQQEDIPVGTDKRDLANNRL